MLLFFHCRCCCWLTAVVSIAAMTIATASPPAMVTVAPIVVVAAVVSMVAVTPMVVPTHSLLQRKGVIASQVNFVTSHIFFAIWAEQTCEGRLNNLIVLPWKNILVLPQVCYVRYYVGQEIIRPCLMAGHSRLGRLRLVDHSDLDKYFQLPSFLDARRSVLFCCVF